MRAIVLDEEGIRFDADYPRPQPAGNEVLVRVLRAGICETDLQLMRGYMGFRGVPGHEFVGVAESGRFVGRRVVGEINCACGHCDFCRGGLSGHCPNRAVIGILNHDGAFADYVAVPEANLHLVPDSIGTDAAVFAEPVAAAFEIAEQVELHPRQRVVVLGDGRLGNLCAQVIRQSGCRLTVLGKHREKLRLLDSAGIETALLEETPRRREADIVVDCTGSPTGIETALQLVRPRGTVVMKTTVAGDQRFPLAQVVVDEITVVGSRCGPFPKALNALAEGRIQVKPLIAGHYPLERGIEALRRAESQPVLKLLLDVDQASRMP